MLNRRWASRWACQTSSSDHRRRTTPPRVPGRAIRFVSPGSPCRGRAEIPTPPTTEARLPPNVRPPGRRHPSTVVIVTGVRTALQRLRDAAADGTLDALCERHGVRLLAAFGSATREGGEEPADLDIAFAGARMAAMLERMDSAWLRALDLEAMGR